MKTAVRVLRGRYRGQIGWIPGTLEERSARGITKAIVKFEGAPAELLATSSLAATDQLSLFQQSELSACVGGRSSLKSQPRAPDLIGSVATKA